MKPKQPVRVPTGFRFRTELLQKLHRESEKTGRTKTKIVEFALHRYLNIKRS